MGRELKRVALDFQWPLDKIWKGYLNPFHKKCPWCESGYLKALWDFEAFMRDLGYAASASETRPVSYKPVIDPLFPKALKSWCSDKEHRFRCRWPWPDLPIVKSLLEIAGLPEDWATEVEAKAILLLAEYDLPEVKYKEQYFSNSDQSYPPYSLSEYGIGDVGPKFWELLEALEARRGFLGWDSLWTAEKKMFDKFGTPPGWEKVTSYEGEVLIGACRPCKGTGIHPDLYEKVMAWEKFEPPAGPGYQVWETVSEGSPVSPVCATEEDLVKWCLSQGYSEDAAKGFLKSSWAPSFVIKDGEMLKNIESCKE